MAPVDHDQLDHNELEQQLKDIIQDLYQVMVQVSTYDSMGRSSRDVLTNEIKTLSHSLQTLHAFASPPNVLPSIPPELIEYVENGRNPDIYTREFVELVRRGNQLMRGKLNAFASFRDVLAEQMTAAMPELREDIAHVVEATGGVSSGRAAEQRNGGASSFASTDAGLPAGTGAPAAGTSSG
ncbi:transcription factor subunit Med10 of mediator complex-domain-containing protein [Dactylonectria estremocensis]|uniref:Mediator of RNA polymerase II transcription subunit 10 n=1 Tax=Dactylonectria estremocensis TaxID=1079267 RepID=A0A9P9JI29_9HYPO|nr:transcription factor subunit Med10 of mediator complex-domain-containing protein [Dactylonectria estremocensis]